MHNQQLENLLIQHADQLNQGLNNTELYLSIYPNERELHTLLELSDWLHETLIPISPKQRFVTRLERKLLKENSSYPIPFSYQLFGGTMLSLIGIFIFWQKRSNRSVIKQTEQNQKSIATQE